MGVSQTLAGGYGTSSGTPSFPGIPSGGIGDSVLLYHRQASPAEFVHFGAYTAVLVILCGVTQDLRMK